MAHKIIRMHRNGPYSNGNGYGGWCDYDHSRSFISTTSTGNVGTPQDVLSLSVLYMRIYFIGMPAFMVYNFGAALLRALGDTKRPLYFLTVSGVVMLFLICFLSSFYIWELPVLRLRQLLHRQYQLV